MRLSIKSLAATWRTLVAVGTDSEASMFEAKVFAIPRSTFTSGWSSSSASTIDIAPVAAGRLAGTGVFTALVTDALATGTVMASVTGDAELS